MRTDVGRARCADFFSQPGLPVRLVAQRKLTPEPPGVKIHEAKSRRNHDLLISTKQIFPRGHGLLIFTKQNRPWMAILLIFMKQILPRDHGHAVAS